MTDVTRILNAIERGDAKATDGLLPLVYEQLRLLATQKLFHDPFDPMSGACRWFSPSR